ncbi:SRPBCC family protein [Streptomyces sp. 8N114]|uniref:SRPBCC family protein n=1 Tax=Streptomyces sp. 8N114 TaxID=3457419 RepID=UPI003FD3516B
MILDNHLDVPADPDAVFALINDVERVAACLPGAILDGRDGDNYLGRVKFKVGPISAAYSGTIRFVEVDDTNRRLQLSARGAESHGNGDAEAEVTLTVSQAPGGSRLDLHTDLSVRGKIAQFGKSAISSVSKRLLEQFARNLTAQLQEQPSPAQPPAATGSAVPAAAYPAAATGQARPAAGGEELDGLAMLLPPGVTRYLPVVAAGLAGLFQGWLLGRIRSQDKLIKELQRGR